MAGVYDWDQGTRVPLAGERSPTRWAPLGQVTIPGMFGNAAATQPINLVGTRQGRAFVYISNLGPDAVRVYPAQNSSLYYTLKIGEAMPFPTEGELWVSSQSGSVIDVLEFWYDLQGAAISGGAPTGSDISGAV